MTNEEKILAGEKWGALKRTYGKEPIAGEVSMAAECFKNYTLDEVDEAMTEYMSEGKFAPVPADIIEIIKRRKGLDKASLELAADKWFNNFDSNVDYHVDNVTTDERAVAAFYIAFGSLGRYGSLSCEPEDFERHKAHFRHVYVNVGEADIKAAGNVITPQEYCINNRNAVKLLGNLKEAKALIPVLYPDRRVRIVNDPDRKVIEAPKPEVKPQEDREAVRARVDAIAEQLKRIFE